MACSIESNRSRVLIVCACLEMKEVWPTYRTGRNSGVEAGGRERFCRTVIRPSDSDRRRIDQGRSHRSGSHRQDRSKRRRVIQRKELEARKKSGAEDERKLTIRWIYRSEMAASRGGRVGGRPQCDITCSTVCKALLRKDYPSQ